MIKWLQKKCLSFFVWNQKRLIKKFRWKRVEAGQQVARWDGECAQALDDEEAATGRMNEYLKKLREL